MQSSNRNSRLTVLIVDDTFAIRMLVRNKLLQAGFQKEKIFEAEHGEAALKKIEHAIKENKSNFDIIYMDNSMGANRLMGFAVTKQVRILETSSEVQPCLLVTHTSDLDFSKKPYDGSDVRINKCFCGHDGLKFDQAQFNAHIEYVQKHFDDKNGQQIRYEKPIFSRRNNSSNSPQFFDCNSDNDNDFDSEDEFKTPNILSPVAWRKTSNT